MVSNAAYRKRMDLHWDTSLNDHKEMIDDGDGVIVGDDERRARAQTVRAMKTSSDTPTTPIDRVRSSTIAPRFIFHQATDEVDAHVWCVYQLHIVCRFTAFKCASCGRVRAMYNSSTCMLFVHTCTHHTRPKKLIGNGPCKNGNVF
jgi:hypothetical protein